MHALYGLAQPGHVAHALVFCDLQHHHARLYAEGAHCTRQRIGTTQCHGLYQRIGADIDEYPTRCAGGAPALQCGVGTYQLKVLQQVLLACHVQQDIGCVPGRSLRPPDECLVGVYRALAQIGQRLKNAIQLPRPHQLGQWPLPLL